MSQSIDCPLTNPELRCNLRPGKPLCSNMAYSVAIHGDSRATKAFALCPGIPQTCPETRSAIKLRSSSATVPRPVNTILSAGVEVSSESDSETNP